MTLQVELIQAIVVVCLKSSATARQGASMPVTVVTAASSVLSVWRLTLELLQEAADEDVFKGGHQESPEGDSGVVVVVAVL